MTKSESKGLRKLKKRVAHGSIIVLKTTKSSKLTVMDRQHYQQLGHEKNGEDKVISRPLVGGCSSDTLGLSNTLSEMIESACMAIEDQFKVISSEDMLSRIKECNRKIEKLRENRKNFQLNSAPSM